ncbi:MULTISPECIES: NADP-dependent oxidoreductase [unclassified Agrococcus]|uniref:NADP-dependent oxidoreductase n=1 Tax=unclassified Agrococcus TaxID=2615065 RepID=UPI00360B5750
MAQQIQYTEFGEPEVMHLVEVPQPDADAGRIVVAVRAAGVNPLDSKLRSGARPSGEITTPRVPGGDAAGEVVEVGEGVEGWTVGDRVVVQGAAGAYATHTVATPQQLHRLPEGVSFEQGAAMGIPASTAYQGLVELELRAGETLLIHAGSGAVGQAAIQLAVLQGATVVATASEANHDRVRELGATPVAYGPGLLDRVREVAPGGVDVVYDCVGSEESMAVSAQLVADPHRIGTIVWSEAAAALGVQGWLGGKPEPLSERTIALRHEAYDVVLGRMAQGSFDVEIAQVMPLADAVEAQRLNVANAVRGKIVLVP